MQHDVLMSLIAKGQIERDITGAESDQEALTLSIAISLKRIAGSLELMESAVSAGFDPEYGAQASLSRIARAADKR